MNAKEKIHVLLLEDDADDYRLITKRLCNQGQQFVADRAETLAAALEKLDQHPFDVVLTDLSVPDSMGLQTVSKLREHCGETPIIVITSLEDECIENDILGVGAQDYLVKGEIGGRAVTRAIQHAVQRQQSLNEVNALVAQLEQSQQLLQEQASLLRKKNLRLRQLYKTAQEFVDNVSHDFRTPLTVIKDYVSIIREGMVGDINDEQQVMLDKVAVRADDLNNMVDDLLDVSKLEAGLLGAWRRNVRVKDMIERAESLLQQRAQTKNVDLTVECEPDLPDVYCDAEKVGRVVANLAINAIKFAGQPGRVRLWTQADPAGHQVVIGVTDNGPGIDKQSMEQLFQRFRQFDSHVKSTVKGFGLGLNIAQQLCRMNLGELSVQSRPGQGSTFSFTIPVADPREVLRRWVTMQGTGADRLQLVEIAVADDVGSKAVEEFDSFLNCQLRTDDLLIRLAPHKWLLVLATTSSESNQWFTRAGREFARVNRNRPMGPLPKYHTKTWCKWNSSETVDVLLEQLDEVVRRSAEALSA